MKFLTLLSLILCYLTSINKLHSQIATDRPDQTESSLVVPKGSLQIEAGAMMEHFDLTEFDNLSSVEEAYPSLLFRYGLSTNFELRLVSTYRKYRVAGVDAKIDGFDDLELGFKWHIAGKENAKTQIAFLSHLILPTASKSISLLEWGVVNKFAISQEVSENLNWGLNLGYDYSQIADNKSKGSLTYSLAIGHGINDKVGVYIEPYGELAELEEFILNMNAGITYLVNPNFQLDFSVGTGVTQKMNFLSAGFSWLILKK